MTHRDKCVIIDGMNKLLSSKRAAEALDVSIEHLRRMESRNEIVCVRTGGGHRRYDVQRFIDEQRKPDTATLCYCRVSGKAQADALESQVEWMREKFPEAEIIKDFGSGINFKGKGLQRILERVLRGDKLRVVVAHRDRLARFGSEVIRYLVEQNGGEIVVLNATAHSPEAELTADLLEILHVFSSRMYGLRRYRDKIKEDTNLTNKDAEADSA